MLRRPRHQFKTKTLLFIIIFSILIFILPEIVFADASDWLDWPTITWRYKDGHMFLEFTSSVSTTELEIYFYNTYAHLEGGNLGGWIEKDITVLEGVAYSMPVIYLNCDSGGSPVENAGGVTPIQVLSLPCISEPLDENSVIDAGTGLKVYIGAGYEYGGSVAVYFTETPQAPSLEASFPITGTSTEVAYGTFKATGSYSFEFQDWNSLEIQLASSTTSTVHKFSVDITDEPSGSYTIPVQMPYAGTFNINYVFYDYITVSTEDFSWDDMFWYQVPIATTTITVGEGVAPDWWDWVEVDTFEEDEPATGTVQHYLWSIKNFFRGIYIPSTEAKTNFWNTILEIRNKFPYNYIDEMKDFFSTTSENIEQDPTIEFGLLDATGTAHTSFFDTNITISAETEPLYEWFKTVSSLFLWGGFLIYCITFIRRIF